MPGFSDWSIKDLDGVLRVEGDRINWHRADRTAIRYAGKQVQVEGGFFHSFVVYFLDGWVENEENRGFIRLWEVRTDWENRTWVYARKNGNGWTIFLEQLSHGDKVITFAGSARLDFGSRYTVKVSRVGSDYRLVVRDATGLTLEDSGDVGGVPQSYSHIWLASTIKSRRNNGNWSTGYIEGLSLACEKI